MNGLLKSLQFNFIPRSAELGLFVLRVWLGLTLLLNHGWAKLMNFSDMAGKFADPIGVGAKASLVLAIFAEVVCATLLVLGIATRFAALVLVIFLGVAFFLVHKRALSGMGSGELAFLYLAGFVTIFLGGPGKFAVDKTSKG